ncbi:MAG: hypothetical protein G01um101466_221 [Parcubacteria group bacterium Gr01-1014_66]|nr:MAG: hypothetical protein G01um101466_221 [Parcubacteria group bacterium Gr01-1014_66]
MEPNFKKSGFGLIGIIIVFAVIAIVSGGGFYLNEARRSKLQSESLVEIEKKSPETKVSPEPQANNAEQKSSPKTGLAVKLAIRGVTESDIHAALDAAKKVQDQFSRPPTQQLTPEQEKELQKYVESIQATQKALSGSGDLVIEMQQPGRNIVITSAVVKDKGFVVIKKKTDFETMRANKDILGISQLLSIGTAKNIQIPLNEYVDGVELKADLYKDDGDGVFSPTSDKYATDAKGWAIYKNFPVSSRRNLQNVYYSNYLQPGSPALLLREQLPGNKIKFESVSRPFDPKNSKKSFFITIFKDADGLPGKIIGSQIIKSGGSGNEIQLTESVSNEMLYAMIFEDNGDSKLDLMSDSIVRGENNLIIIIKFKVIQ